MSSIEILLILIFLIFILYHFIRLLLNLISFRIRISIFSFLEKIIFYLIFLSPLLLIFIGFLVFNEDFLFKFFNFLKSQLYNLPFLIVGGVFLIFLLIFYFLIAWQPQIIAYNFLIYFREKIPLDREYLWAVLDKVRRRRFLVIFVLFLTLSVFFVIDIFLLSIFLKKYSPLSFQQKFLFFAILFLSVFYILGELFFKQKVKEPEIDHKMKREVSRIVKKLSITRGIKEPQFKIIKNNVPNIFSLYHNIKRPIIYITTSLLNILDRNELESVIASQITEIYSGVLFDYKVISNILLILKFLSFPTFFIFLFLYGEKIVLFWFILLFILIVINFLEFLSNEADILFPLDFLINFLNPIFLFVSFLSFLIYYFLNFNDLIHTDLKSIELTRYPEAYYSMLDKVQNFKNYFDSLPKEFYYLYLFGDNIGSIEFPLPQPPIYLRKRVISSIFPYIKNAIFRRSESLICPYCKNYMKEIEVAGHYGTTIKIDQCDFCGSVWFDEIELFCLSESVARLAGLLFEKTYKERLKKILLPNEFFCPRCGVKLNKLRDPIIPFNINILICPTCEGNFMTLKDLYEYYKYRETAKEAKVKKFYLNFIQKKK